MQKQTVNPLFWYDETIQMKILNYLSNYYGLHNLSIYDILRFEFDYVDDELRKIFHRGAAFLYSPLNGNGLNPIAEPDELNKKIHSRFRTTNDQNIYLFIINMKYLSDSNFISGFNYDLEALTTISADDFFAPKIGITHLGVNRLRTILQN